MPFPSLKAAKDGGFNTKLDDIALTLSQVNEIARQYDAVKAEGTADQPMAVAVAAFKKSHKHNDDGTAWVAKKTEEAMVKEPWELTVDDLPVAFRDYPKLAKETALSFFRVGIEGGFTEEEAAEIALAAVAKKWQKGDGEKWVYTGEAEPAIRFTGDVLRESAIVETCAFAAGPVEIRESKDGFKRIVTPLLSVGFSKNKTTVESRRGKVYPRYYPAAELERVAPTMEGLTVYVGNKEHDDDVGVWEELGIYEGAHFAAGAIRGAVKVFSDKTWVVDRLRASSRAFGGLSIEGGASHKVAVVGGQEAAVVEGLNVKCARLVKNPAAAGSIEGIRESEGGEPPMELTLQQLKEGHPAVYDAARKEFLSEGEQKAKDAKIAELSEAAKAKDAEIAKLKEAATAAESVTLIEAAMPRDEKGNHLMPEKARAKLLESLKGETDKAKIAEAVKEMAEILSEATRAGKVFGAGSSGGSSAPDNTQTVKESQKACDALMGVPEPPAPEK